MRRNLTTSKSTFERRSKRFRLSVEATMEENESIVSRDIEIENGKSKSKTDDFFEFFRL